MLPYTLRVEEVFDFGGGVTVLAGELEAGSPPVLAPSTVELIVDGRSLGAIALDSERMPGPGSEGRRAVETRANIRAEDLGGRRCLLVHR
ncbi:hypothetical protein WME99_35205 [Sorangium sp. So ce136]|uniref:hypothetical protein n=1 Tax=Sorangium sp. So ce136 TaxID=3133284 RepID=UPI003F0F7A64